LISFAALSPVSHSRETILTNRSEQTELINPGTKTDTFSKI